jgi:hypothetical protein
VVTYMKFIHMPVEIIWLHRYKVYIHAHGDYTVTEISSL